MEIIEKDLYKVIAYFSYFGYPVTSFEIYKYQLNPHREYSLGEVLKCLRSSAWLKTQISSKNGFFAIALKTSIDDQIKNRHDRYLNAVQEDKKLMRVVSYVSRLPFVIGGAVCNSLAFHFTEERSDFDLFILNQYNRLWSARLFSVPL